MEKFIKNIVLLIFGFIVGSALVSAGLYIMYKSIFINTSQVPPVISKQDISIDNEYLRNEPYTPAKIIPQKDISTSIQSPLLTQGYKDSLSKTVSYINTLIIENNTIILPAMQSLPSRLSTGDWKTVFDEISKVKMKIESVKAASVSLSSELLTLEKSNQSNKSDEVKRRTVEYITAAKQFNDTYAKYIVDQTELLDGNVPSQAKLQKLSSTIEVLRGHTGELQKKGTLLFTTINTLENKK